MEDIICHKDSSFSDGDPQKTKRTYKTPGYFRDLPFEEIYHDSWFTPDRREEIMRYREAQVVMPDQLGLESLQLIWVRSPAEYETLRTLLPSAVWDKWRDKITARRDYHLFNNKRPYVQEAVLQPDHIVLRFNPCQHADDCAPYRASMKITLPDGKMFSWEEENCSVAEDLLLRLPKAAPAYQVRFFLDEDLAYAGNFSSVMEIL